MSAEASRETQELEANLAFVLAAAAVRQRFEQVVELDEDNPAYVHLQNDSDPDVPHALGTFKLVERYELFSRQEGDSLEISVPLAEPDINNPEIIMGSSSETNYFIVTARRKGVERAKRIDPEAARRDLRRKQRRLQLDELTEKILTYTIVPLDAHNVDPDSYDNDIDDDA